MSTCDRRIHRRPIDRVQSFTTVARRLPSARAMNKSKLMVWTRAERRRSKWRCVFLAFGNTVVVVVVVVRQRRHTGSRLCSRRADQIFGPNLRCQSTTEPIIDGATHVHAILACSAPTSMCTVSCCDFARPLFDSMQSFLSLCRFCKQ